MSQGELSALAVSVFLPRASLPASPFGFMVIDDPVQSMDPAKVDGLARVLAHAAEQRQVIVFTHDERLPEAVRRLDIDARIMRVLRRAASKIEVVASPPPSDRYVGEAFAFAKTTDVSEEVRARVLPGLCRSAIEAACVAQLRRRLIESGKPHADVEAFLAEDRSLNAWLAEVVRAVARAGHRDHRPRPPARRRGRGRDGERRQAWLAPRRRGRRPPAGGGDQGAGSRARARMTTLTPDDLLAEAQRMLDEAGTATVAVWPRAVALLARQALEEALRGYWAEHAPGVERLNMRAQLTCLRAYLSSPDLARDVSFAWHALSRATHHHAYELDPTREELASLVAAARRLVAGIVRSPARAATHQR